MFDLISNLREQHILVLSLLCYAGDYCSSCKWVNCLDKYQKYWMSILEKVQHTWIRTLLFDIQLFKSNLSNLMMSWFLREVVKRLLRCKFSDKCQSVITSIITDRIGQHKVLLPIKQEYDKIWERNLDIN